MIRTTRLSLVLLKILATYSVLMADLSSQQRDIVRVEQPADQNFKQTAFYKADLMAL